MRILLDTSLLVEGERRNFDLGKWVVAARHEVFICDATVAEYIAGKPLKDAWQGATLAELLAKSSPAASGGVPLKISSNSDESIENIDECPSLSLHVPWCREAGMVRAAGFEPAGNFEFIGEFR